MNRKIAGYLMLLDSIYYMIAEFISANFYKGFLLDTYLFHTISELGIPGVNSPLFFLMNSAFIIIGLALVLAYFIQFKDYIIKNQIIVAILTLITAIGVIIVALIHGGNPVTSSYHSSGAVMAILGGNILLVIVSKSMDKFEKYQKISVILGLIGIIAFWIMFFNMGSIYMPVFERLSVYTLIIWNFISGVYMLRND